MIVQEIALQNERRHGRVAEFLTHLDELEDSAEGKQSARLLRDAAWAMHLNIDAISRKSLLSIIGPVLTKRVPVRDKQIRYDEAALPKIDPKKQYAAFDIVTASMKVFARDSRVVSIDSDLASTSGLEAGIAAVDQRRALNVGVAEANMMLVGEAFAALGYNTWTSTFCPFFNWQVMRRTAVGQQERLEAIAAPDGWLSEGHGLDLTYLATASNFETRTNDATHMGNDDITTFDAVGQLKIIDVSCPQQMLSIMKWIMAGNRGLLYVRVMRTGSAVLYGSDYIFEFGKAHFLQQNANDAAVLISSGRGVHEALGAAALCSEQGVGVTVVDMPSVDSDLLLEIYNSGKLLLFAEQNNGYLFQNLLKVIYQNRDKASGSLKNVATVNTLTSEGRPQFIHSATYEELVEAYRLTPAHLAKTIQAALSAR
jgi:transketolase C-terminal domain/subunit